MFFVPPIGLSNSNIINSPEENSKKRKEIDTKEITKEEIIEAESFIPLSALDPEVMEVVNNCNFRDILPSLNSIQNFNSNPSFSSSQLFNNQCPAGTSPLPPVVLTQKNERQNPPTKSSTVFQKKILPPNPVPQNLSSQPVINPPPNKKPRIPAKQVELKEQVQTLTQKEQATKLQRQLNLASEIKNKAQSQSTQVSSSIQQLTGQVQSSKQTINKELTENQESNPKLIPSKTYYLSPNTKMYDLSSYILRDSFKTVFRPTLESKVIQILHTSYKGMQLNKLNALLIGPSGCGKFQLFENIASRILRNNQQPSIPTICALNTNHIIQSCRDLSRIDSEIKNKIEEIFAFIHKNHPGRSILGLRYFDKLFDVSSANFLVATFHSLLIQYPNIQVVGITSEEGYQKTLQKHPLFSIFFRSVQMETMDKETTLKVLTQHYSGCVDSHILEAAVNLSNRYLPQESNPLKSINLIEDCFGYLSLQNEKPIVTQELLWRAIANRAKIPVEQIQEDTENSVELFEKKLKEAVIGQDHVLKAVAEDILCFKGGWNNAQKPPMVYVFAGPTGVGKTELAKRIAKVLFGNEKNFIRLDMGEYHAPHTKARLIGSPPGYVGYNEGGQLTGALEKTPSCVVLLDEIEKAHPEVLKIFLPVFDEGRLTSSQGKEFNCKNVCFIMTTNLGAKEIEEKLKIANSINEEQMKEVINPLISSQFGPEWLNRVKVFPFFPLTKEKCQEIVTIHLNRLALEFADQKQIHFTWTKEVVTWLTEKGFDPLMGARPLIQQIDQTIRLAMAKAAGLEQIQPRNHVLCSVNAKGEIQIHNMEKENSKKKDEQLVNK